VTTIEIAYPTDRDGNWVIYFTDGRIETNLTRKPAADY